MTSGISEGRQQGGKEREGREGGTGAACLNKDLKHTAFQRGAAPFYDARGVWGGMRGVEGAAVGEGGEGGQAGGGFQGQYNMLPSRSPLPQ